MANKQIEPENVNVEEEVKFLREQLQKYKMQAEDMQVLKQSVEDIKQSVVETKMLKVELDQYKTKLNNITKARVKKRTKEEMDILDRFFEQHIVFEKGSLIKTSDVMTKANEVLAHLNIRFNKFEVAQFMKDKGAVKKKGPNHTYYVDLKFV